jgi:hypothetical protein
MRKVLRQIDDLLRGKYTRPEDLAAGEIRVSPRLLVGAGLLLGAVYGAFMGLYGVLRPENASYLQLVATVFKVPLLFLLTLVVTVPSLYVFSAIAGSRLDFDRTLRLLLASIAINLAVLASLGPITGFFTLSTESYPFMQVLNVIFFGVAGVIGIAFLRKALEGVFAAPGATAGAEAEPPSDESDVVEEPEEDAPEEEGDGAAGGKAEGAGGEDEGEWKEWSPPRAVHPAPRAPGTAPRRADAPRVVFRLWAIIFGVVGAQMGWILRPFIGTPEMPFTLFRQRESNFFEALFRALGNLFG